MDISSLLTYAPQAGAVGVLVFVVYCLISGKLVPGYLYEQLRRKNEDLFNAVLQSQDAARLALQTNLRRRQDNEDQRQ